MFALCILCNFEMLWCSHQNQAIIFCLENARRTIEVSVPVAASVDSSQEDSVSPGSVTSVRR